MATQVDYESFWLNQLNGTGVVDFDTDTMKLMILTSAYTINLATHVFIDDVSANEVSGTNYNAGGNAVTGGAVTGTGTIKVDANNVNISQSAGGFSNGRYGVYYKDTGTPATSPLVSVTDFGSDKGNVGGALNFEWNSGGIFTV